MDASTPDRHDKHSGFGRVPLGILDLGVFAGAFFFRWLTVEFPNDHFMHLSRARQILLGDVPIRDFFDAGLFLQYYLSSAAQLLFGYNLYGEAVLTISFVAFGTMLVFHLSAQLSGSRWLAAGATLLTVLAFPRLYNYPKVFLYVSAIGLVWLYARRGSRLHVSLMAALTAVAFLLRHDHGVYIAGMMVCFLGLREWGGALLWRRLGLYASVTAGLLLPFLVFVQMTTGLVSYARGSGAPANMIASSLTSLLTNPVPFEIDWSAPLLVIDPPTGPINVRWTETADDTARREREVYYGLTAGVRLDGRTWSYVLTDHESGNLRALVEDRMVEDSAGIDRGTFQVIPERWSSWLTRRLFLLRLRGLLPGVFTAQNALAWFYYLSLLLPVAALGWIGADWWAGRVARPEAAIVASAAILCGIISHTLVRGAPNAYLPDVAAPTFVVAAWLVRRIAVPGGSLVRTRLRRAGIVGVVLVTFWSVWTVGGVGSRLARAGVLDGPAGVWTQLGVVTRGLRNRPIDEWAPPGSTGLRALTRYVLDCTAPSDRVLVTWLEPGVFYYAERGFAGGQVSLHRYKNSDATGETGWHSSPADQRLTVERMLRQSVPVILGRRDMDEEFRQGFPLIYDYVRTRYRLAAESTFRDVQAGFLVFVDSSLEPYADHPDLGLPCYRETMADIRGFDDGPFIEVRWVDDLEDTQRTVLERSLGLYRGEHRAGSNWRYRVPDLSPDRFDTIVAHDMVADTYGFDAATDARFGPAIHVRWVETLEDARRTKLERALGLYRAEHTEGTTWRYQMPDASPQRLRTIVAHDMVVDTNGFDRRSLELNASADDVARLAVQPPVYTSGWHPPEFDPTLPELTWNWTQQTATLSFANPNADAVFYLDYTARPDVFADGPQTVTVRTSEQVLESFEADVDGQRLHGILLPLAALGNGDRVEIQIAVDRTFVPASLPAGGPDRRTLGIQVYRAFVVLR